MAALYSVLWHSILSHEVAVISAEILLSVWCGFYFVYKYNSKNLSYTMARFERTHLFSISLFFLLSRLFIFFYVEKSYVILGSVLCFLNSCCSSFSFCFCSDSFQNHYRFFFFYLSCLSTKFWIKNIPWCVRWWFYHYVPIPQCYWCVIAPQAPNSLACGYESCLCFSFLRDQSYCANVNQLLIAFKGFNLNRENEMAEMKKMESQDGIKYLDLNCWILCKDKSDILCRECKKNTNTVMMMNFQRHLYLWFPGKIMTKASALTFQ